MRRSSPAVRSGMDASEAVVQFGRMVPTMLVDDPLRAARFWVDHFGLVPTAQFDWFVGLDHGERPEYLLDFVRRNHESLPAGFNDRPSSVLLAFVVEDATAEYGRLRAAGPRIVEPLGDKPWGRRRFVGLGPTGQLLVEALRIIGPPSAEFLAANTPIGG